MSIPPSTVKVIPVTNCASGESKRSATIPHIKKKKKSPSLLRLLGLHKPDQLPTHVHSAVYGQSHTRHELREWGKQAICNHSTYQKEKEISFSSPFVRFAPARSVTHACPFRRLPSKSYPSRTARVGRANRLSRQRCHLGGQCVQGQSP